MYVVIENTPGYLPEDDDPATFEDLDSAIGYMRERVNDYADFVSECEESVPDVAVSDDGREAYVVSAIRPHDLGRVFEVHFTEDCDGCS